MIEISLKSEGKDLFEYHSDVIPRMNELMELDVDNDKGTYRVREVIHHVFRETKSGEILSYVEVKVKRMTFQD